MDFETEKNKNQKAFLDSRKGLHRWVWLALFGLMVGYGCKNKHASVSKTMAETAYTYTAEILSFGPREPASEGSKKVAQWLGKKVEESGLVLRKHPFEASTPLGNIKMTNLSVEVKGQTSQERVLFVAHYDTKTFKTISFVGANDAASSVALLLALLPVFDQRKYAFDVEVVWVDGEEAYHHFGPHDGIYGSKVYAKQAQFGKPIKAVIGVDMISDEDLTLIKASGIDAGLLKRLEKVLADMNQSSLLDSKWMGVTDDFTPFVDQGFPTLHLMDFSFGGPTPGKLWHTENDTLEHVSKKSLSIVSEVILRLLDDLDGSK
ncbi:MAG: M28 family peptidase [Bdellovibrionota bacterium]